jgi:hypothetical protein
MNVVIVMPQIHLRLISESDYSYFVIIGPFVVSP